MQYNNPTPYAQGSQPFEVGLGQFAYRQTSEKSFIDKLLSRREVEALKVLMMKEELTRSELLQLLYMLTGGELKLANLNEDDRYMMGKYFIWVREFVKVAEFLYDYEEALKKMKIKKQLVDKDNVILDTIKDEKKMLLHNVKVAADIFVFLTRSTLGLSGLCFDTLSKQRFEYEYEQPQYNMQHQAPEQKTFMGIKLGGGK